MSMASYLLYYMLTIIAATVLITMYRYFNIFEESNAKFSILLFVGGMFAFQVGRSLQLPKAYGNGYSE